MKHIQNFIGSMDSSPFLRSSTWGSSIKKSTPYLVKAGIPDFDAVSPRIPTPKPISTSTAPIKAPGPAGGGSHLSKPRITLDGKISQVEDDSEDHEHHLEEPPKRLTDVDENEVFIVAPGPAGGGSHLSKPKITLDGKISQEEETGLPVSTTPDPVIETNGTGGFLNSYINPSNWIKSLYSKGTGEEMPEETQQHMEAAVDSNKTAIYIVAAILLFLIYKYLK